MTAYRTLAARIILATACVLAAAGAMSSPYAIRHGLPLVLPAGSAAGTLVLVPSAVRTRPPVPR